MRSKDDPREEESAELVSAMEDWYPLARAELEKRSPVEGVIKEV